MVKKNNLKVKKINCHFSLKWSLKEGSALIEELILSILSLIKSAPNNRCKERNFFKILKNKGSVKRYFSTI
jgi:hypothetical protein